MNKFFMQLLLIIFFGLFIVNNGFSMTLDDFFPPAQGGTQEVEGAVSQNGDIISAESMQDGMNYAFQTILEEGGAGVRTVNTKTGIGIIAGASRDYKSWDNLNATLLSKRGAYFRAFTDAQRQLVGYMEGFQNNCEASISSGVVTIDTGIEGVTGSYEGTKEVCGELVSGVLRGYIIYEVQDNVDEKTVTVSIASSTKTRSALDRVGGAVIVSSNPDNVFKQIATEVSKGVVAPLGAKLIICPESREPIIIGFGSAIIRQNSDRAMQRRMTDMAKRQSQTRANSALVSFLNGSDVYWKGGFDETQFESSEQFDFPVDEEGNIGDPIIFEDTKNTFLNVVKQSDDYKVVTSGQVPPGVQSRTIQSEDGYWMSTLSVYKPSFTAQAIQAGKENKNAGSQTQSQRKPEGRKMELQGGLSEDSPNPKGPSGRSVNDHDF